MFIAYSYIYISTKYLKIKQNYPNNQQWISLPTVTLKQVLN